MDWNLRGVVQRQGLNHYAKWTNNTCAIIVMSCANSRLGETFAPCVGEYSTNCPRC